MDLELAGKSALVTGASKGIGRAIAEALAAEGCTLHLAARTEADLASVRDDLTARFGAQATIHPGDLGLFSEVEWLAAVCADVDILVNNAGAIPAGDLARVDDATWRTAWDLKVFGFVGLARALYPRMCDRGSGVIVNIIGTGGERPNANFIAGSMANASLMALTTALGAGSLDHGVRVVGINPGPIETERLLVQSERRAEVDFGDRGRWREVLANLPAGRPGLPREVADVAAFLASPRASWISGTVINVDGGQHARAPH
jgi:NAD(P)-dependent dehydrogenase (short-subunit alcohol dehydrogenase family)